MGWAHNRQYYRVTYPPPLRPRLEIHEYQFEVLDLCERGMRFSLGDAAPPDPGQEVRGTLRFRRGEALEVGGVVLRRERGEVAVHLETAVPRRVIREEQRFLLDRSRHPAT